MNNTEQQLHAELTAALAARNAEPHPMKRLALIKQVQELRAKLGLIRDVNEIDPQHLTELILPENGTKAEKRKAVEKWLKDNLQNKASDQLKFIKTSDGKKVFFNRKESIDHFTSDCGRFNDLGFKSVIKIPEVFSFGRCIGVEPLHKKRKDAFIAFHIYRKIVELGDYLVELQVKAGERKNGILEIDGKLVGYTFKLLEMLDCTKLLPVSSAADTNSGNCHTTTQRSSPPSSSEIGTLAGGLATDENHTLSLDDIQAENDFLVQILRVWDKYGDPIEWD